MADSTTTTRPEETPPELRSLADEPELQEFETDDLWVASALVSLGFPAPLVEPEPGTSPARPMSTFRFLYPPRQADLLTRLLAEYAAAQPSTVMGRFRRMKSFYIGLRTASSSLRKEGRARDRAEERRNRRNGKAGK